MFVFPAGTPGHTVLILDVHPIAPASGAAFHPDAVHRIQIDTDGDDLADIAYSFVFSDAGDGRQTADVPRARRRAGRAPGAPRS